MSLTMHQALTASEFHDEGRTGRPCTDRHGPVRWRRNGVTRTWKRNPTHFKIPVKWGLKGYGYIKGDAAKPETTASFHTAEDCPALVQQAGA